MSNCTNCFSGCVETTSDKCVKYTGNSIDFLHIDKGDSLEKVEEAITNWLATVLNGKGILPVTDSNVICDIVDIPNDPTLVDILNSIIKAACDIDASLVAEVARVDAIEEDYTIGDCLTSNPDDGTHIILQEVINVLCTAVDDIDTLNDLFAICITTSNIDTYIQNYLTVHSTTNLMYTKMVPYVIYPFYPTHTVLNLFSNTGAGSGIWDKVYFCNGLNSTPDLRGRSLIGVVSSMRSDHYETQVDPAGGNENYALGDTNGLNHVVLDTSEVGAHTHAATVTVTDPGHLTSINYRQDELGVLNGTGADSYPIFSINEVPAGYKGTGFDENTSTHLDTTNLDGNITAVNTSTPTAVGHDNVHPVYACYYIMYLP